MRLLDRHPAVAIVGLVGRDRDDEPVGTIHPHLASTTHLVDASLPAADAVFLALPHGTAAELVPEIVADGATVIDLGPTSGCTTRPTIRAGTASAIPTPSSSRSPCTGCPSSTAMRSSHSATLRCGSWERPGCYPTATLLALAPLARAGLIADLVVDAKSGVSGAGREPKADLHFGEVNESVRAYGLGGHRHVAEIEQELAALSADRICGRTRTRVRSGSTSSPTSSR